MGETRNINFIELSKVYGNTCSWRGSQQLPNILGVWWIQKQTESQDRKRIEVGSWNSRYFQNICKIYKLHGSATRTSQITGNDSPHDISLCGNNRSAKTSWWLAEPIGSSDHLPIIIEVNQKICYRPVIPRSARWRRNGADWSSFTNEVESKMSNLPPEPTYLFGFLSSITSSSLQQLLTSENLNPARLQNLGWLHISEPKSAFEIASVKRFIKIARIG